MLNYFVVDHNVKLNLIDEIDYDSSHSHSLGEKYFFVKDEAYLNFYDGIELLKYYLPEYDSSKLNTKKYTYLISVNGKVDSVVYTGRSFNRRYSAMPDEYRASIQYEETNDGIIRIYQINKMNIDYDYHYHAE